MSSCIWVFLAIYIFLGIKDTDFLGGGYNGNSLYQTITEESEGICKKAVALVQARQATTFEGTDQSHLRSVGTTPLQGREVLADNRSNHGATTLALWMREAQQEDCKAMRDMSMGICTTAWAVGMGPSSMGQLLGRKPMGSVSEKTTEPGCTVARFHQIQVRKPEAEDLSGVSQTPRSKETQEEQELSETERRVGGATLEMGGAFSPITARSGDGKLITGQPQRGANRCSKIQGVAEPAQESTRQTDTRDPSHCDQGNCARDQRSCKIPAQCSLQNGKGAGGVERRQWSPTSIAQSLAYLHRLCNSAMENVDRGLSERRCRSTGEDQDRQGIFGRCSGRIWSAAHAVWTQRAHRDCGRRGQHCRRGGWQDQGEHGQHDAIPGRCEGESRYAVCRAGEGCQKAAHRSTRWNWICIGAAAFWHARQDRALGSACLGQIEGVPQLKCIPWAHTVGDEWNFAATWEASMRGWLAAIECDEPLQGPGCCASLRTRDTIRNRVTFSKELEVCFYSYHGLLGGQTKMLEAGLRHWEDKPWALRPRIDPSSRTRIAPGADQDEVSWMQTGKPKTMRGETEIPNWALVMGQHHQVPHHDDTNSEDQSGEERSEREEGDEASYGDRSNGEAQVDESLQSVILFHLDDPAVHSHVHWTHIEDVITEISVIMQVQRNQKRNIHELRWAPLDIPGHLAPLIVQLEDDIPHGSAHVLCLVDVEVHANVAEFNYATVPAIDRRVLAVPNPTRRQQLLELTRVAPYCREVQHRCLVVHNGMLLKLQDSEVTQISSGDHLKIVVPPDIFCEDATSYRINEAIEREQEQRRSPLRTPEDGYSPSLVPSEEIRLEFGRASEPEELELLQIGKEVHHPITSPKGSDADPLAEQEACIALPPSLDAPEPLKHSWTEEFLRAMGAVNVAQDEMPEFPLPDPRDADQQHAWVRDLIPVWQQNARPGPAGVEMLAKVETWYTDHR